METGQDRAEQRPHTALTPPPVDCDDRELLEHLLKIELERLRVAQQIEIDRETVFPETSVIVRDVMKLRAILGGLDDGGGVDDLPANNAGGDDDLLDVLLREVT